MILRSDCGATWLRVFSPPERILQASQWLGIVEGQLFGGKVAGERVLPEDVGFIAELDGPFSLATVAASLVGGHD